MVWKILILFILVFPGCLEGEEADTNPPPALDTLPILVDTPPPAPKIISHHLDPDTLLAFARTLQGVPYLYASTDPALGFDCSGFITYVFNHFGIRVPRSSVDFTNYGRDISKEETRPGDIILFTGTDSTTGIVGHMGIVESIRNDTIHFIHSTSGKAKGVVITPMGNYYNSRFVKLIRVFPDSLFH